MADVFKVTPAELSAAGATVGWPAEDVAARHAAADAAIEAAGPGWAGALAARMAQWQAMTAALVEQLDTHAATFAQSRAVYDEVEDAGAQQLSSQRCSTVELKWLSPEPKKPQGLGAPS